MTEERRNFRLSAGWLTAVRYVLIFDVCLLKVRCCVEEKKNVREISAPPCGPESSTGRDSESVSVSASVFAFRGVVPQTRRDRKKKLFRPVSECVERLVEGSETDRPEKVSGTRLWWKIFTLSLVAAGREVGTRANLKNRLFSEEPNRAAAAAPQKPGGNPRGGAEGGGEGAEGGQHLLRVRELVHSWQIKHETNDTKTRKKEINLTPNKCDFVEAQARLH